MTKKFRVWLDSGANHDSCREQIISLTDLNISDEQWDSMGEEDRENEMREIAFEHSDWGFCEIDS